MFSKNIFRKQWHAVIIDETNLTLEKMFIGMHLHLYLWHMANNVLFTSRLLINAVLTQQNKQKQNYQGK